MADDAWERRRIAKEEEFFQRQNKDAMARLSVRKSDAPRSCPVDGNAMEQRTLMGVNIDQCASCHGIWLDGGELDAILKAAPDNEKAKSGWLHGLFESLTVK